MSDVSVAVGGSQKYTTTVFWAQWTKGSDTVRDKSEWLYMSTHIGSQTEIYCQTYIILQFKVAT